MQDHVVHSGLDALHRRLAEDPGAAISLGFLEHARASLTGSTVAASGE
jgi:hypothetical protein